MKGIKKILALVLVAMMIMAMSMSALAALGSDSADQETGVQENGDPITINTVVVVTNNEKAEAAGKTINYPAMDFKYTVAPATVAAGTTVADADREPGYHNAEGDKQIKVEVKQGPEGGITVSGGHKDAGTVVLNKNGEEAVVVPTTFTGIISAFTAAGIYRYKITDESTTDATNLGKLTTAGINKGASVDQEYFLDVYVKNGTSGLEFGGFVLMSSNPGADGTESIDKQNNKSMDAKESGFDEVDVITTTDPTDPNKTETKLDPDKTVDYSKNYSYTTYNVTLKKEVMGGLGDKKHPFPFAVAIGVQAVAEGATAHPTLAYGYEVTGGTVDSIKHTYDALEAIPADFALSDGAELKIWGLSPFATINYTETNDTDSTYKVKVGNEAKGAQFQAEADKAKNATTVAFSTTSGETTTETPKNVADNYALATAATLNADADHVYFTNTLNDISPTGLVLRFAPYMAMFAAGVALFIILGIKRRKSEEE